MRLDTEKLLNLMTSLFQRGLALDVIDISGKRDNPDITQDEKLLYDAAEASLNRVDLDELYDNAKALLIPEKYPEFYKYLCDRKLELEENSHDERTPEDTPETEIEDAETEAEVPEEVLSTKDKVLREIVGGHHTGDERDSEKYVKKDEFRDMLTEEYNQMMKNAPEVDGDKEDGRYIEDSYQQTGQSEVSEDNKSNQADFVFTRKKETKNDDSNLVFGDEHIVRGSNYHNRHDDERKKTEAVLRHGSKIEKKDESKISTETQTKDGDSKEKFLSHKEHRDKTKVRERHQEHEFEPSAVDKSDASFRAVIHNEISDNPNLEDGKSSNDDTSSRKSAVNSNDDITLGSDTHTDKTDVFLQNSYEQAGQEQRQEQRESGHYDIPDSKSVQNEYLKETESKTSRIHQEPVKQDRDADNNNTTDEKITPKQAEKNIDIDTGISPRKSLSVSKHDTSPSFGVHLEEKNSLSQSAYERTDNQEQNEQNFEEPETEIPSKPNKVTYERKENTFIQDSYEHVGQHESGYYDNHEATFSQQGNLPETNRKPDGTLIQNGSSKPESGSISRTSDAAERLVHKEPEENNNSGYGYRKYSLHPNKGNHLKKEDVFTQDSYGQSEQNELHDKNSADESYTVEEAVSNSDVVYKDASENLSKSAEANEEGSKETKNDNPDVKDQQAVRDELFSKKLTEYQESSFVQNSYEQAGQRESESGSGYETTFAYGKNHTVNNAQPDTVLTRKSEVPSDSRGLNKINEDHKTPIRSKTKENADPAHRFYSPGVYKSDASPNNGQDSKKEDASAPVQNPQNSYKSSEKHGFGNTFADKSLSDKNYVTENDILDTPESEKPQESFFVQNSYEQAGQKYPEDYTYDDTSGYSDGRMSSGVMTVTQEGLGNGFIHARENEDINANSQRAMKDELLSRAADTEVLENTFAQGSYGQKEGIGNRNVLDNRSFGDTVIQSKKNDDGISSATTALSAAYIASKILKEKDGDNVSRKVIKNLEESTQNIAVPQTDGTNSFDSNKFVTDSYTNAMLSSLYGDTYYTFGSEMEANDKTPEGDCVDVGIYGKINGNSVSLLVNGNVKQYAKRPDDTVLVNDKVMNVYDLGSDRVFVGWRSVPLINKKAVLHTGESIELDEDGNIVKSDAEYCNELKAYKHFLPQKQTPTYISYAPMVANNIPTEIDFVRNGDMYTSSLLNYQYGKNIGEILNAGEISRTIEKQGFLMQAMVGQKALREMYDNVQISENDMKVLVSNYDKLIAVNGVTAYRTCKINAIFEERYLSVDEQSKLKELRKKLKENNLTENVDSLSLMLQSGELTGESAVTAREYIEFYSKTREKIIKEGILRFDAEKASKRNVCAERGFYAASMIVLLNENGLPTDIKELKAKLKNNQIDEEKRNLAENSLKILRAVKLADAAQNMMIASITASMRFAKNAAKSTYRNAKQFMSRYMGDDYSTRGLLLLITAVEAPMKAVRIAIRSYRLGKLSAKLAINTGKTAMAGMRLGAAGVRGLSKGARFAYMHGARSTARAVTKRLKAVKVSKTRMIKRTGVAIKKAAMTFIKFVIRILQLLVTSLMSIIGPVAFFLILALIIVFTIFSFIKNSGDTVYYDAGDEDTSEVVQEMVDLLTLCHASFRDGLTNQFGGGVSSSATGANGSAMNAPQLKKGESSPVKGLYDVLPSTWANWEFGYPYPTMAAGTKQRELQDKITSGQIKARNNGGMLFLDDKMYAAAFTTYWGNVGDVLKVEFEGSMAIGDQPATNTLYIVITDIKNFAHTGYPEQKDGLYGHPLGGHRDFAEFFWWEGASRPQLNGSSLGSPLKATNMGNILDGTCDMSTIGTSGTAGGSNVNADILYRQEIDQDVYREIINREKNIYYTFPEDQEVPDGITPTPTPKIDKDKGKTGEIYGFYNNNQEIISMALAMFDFDINSSTSAKRTVLSTADVSGADSAAADAAQLRGVTDKINDDTWKLITYFDENGLNFNTTKYKEGGYDDLRYSAVVGLFNASHIVTGTPVLEYHEGPDGTINPVYNDDGRIVEQNNTDGMSYQVPVIVTDYKNVVNDDGTVSAIPYTHYQTDADGEIVYETKYAPCPGHRKMSAAVITLHFDSLLNMKSWWEENIYNVDDFDKENPNYSSDKKDDENYNAKGTVLKRQFQYIKKPDFYKPVSGTCEQSSSGSSGFSPGTMTESQVEVARTVYDYLTGPKMNLTKEQAIGVLVNIKRECDFNYTLVEAGSGAGYGLCQWTGGRRDNLMQWCNAHPQDGAYNTLQGQLSYLNAEFTVHADVWTGNGVAGFRECSTEREAGEYFIRYFERPQAEYMNQRIAEMDSDIATVKSYLNLT